MDTSIVFIVGSLRAQSFNRQLAQAAEELIGDRATVTYLEYADLPPMNQDIEYPPPEGVARARATIQAADGVWIFTPEYNHEIPGTLKNLLDWLSRPLKQNSVTRATAVAGKPVTASGAGGKSATADCRRHLNDMLELMKMKVMREGQVGISLPPTAFVTGSFKVTDDHKARLARQADAFLDFIG